MQGHNVHTHIQSHTQTNHSKINEEQEGNKLGSHHHWSSDQMAASITGGAKFGPVVMATIKLAIFLKVPFV